MPAETSSHRSLLSHVYEALDFESGALLKAASSPGISTSADEWQLAGDWLLLADRVGAESVFFVGADPVLVFSSMPAGSTEAEVVAMYRKSWSLARPRCLFLAVNDELRVYSLTDLPPDGTPGRAALKPLEVVKRAADVGEQLAQFHRDRVEDGSAFDSPPMRRKGARADEQLMQDVQAATAALIDQDLERHVAHALIERAILIRYLEDRGVLVPAYFETLAKDRSEWHLVLNAEPTVANFGAQSMLMRCLGDQELTYAFFAKLEEDFNGDLFAVVPGETDQVTSAHLALVQAMLNGTASVTQDPLFLWAYDFGVVPTSLVSTMYELFYHQEVDGRATSTYYTPADLVEYVSREVFTKRVLDQSPRICDPACGSGVFLVEAYRQIVRHEMARTGAALSTEALRELLMKRIVGVDLDEAAVRLAAFSLYVALLNYQTPQDIMKAGPLPRLISDPETGAQAPLTVGDAFWPMRHASGSEHQTEGIDWPADGFDVIVGNPPWTEPAKGNQTAAERWAKAQKRTIGDRNPSQLFMWRALDLLADKGVAALLVGAGPLLNARSTTERFRKEWLSAASVEHVVNFSEVRGHFFAQGTAPFMLVRFRRDSVEKTSDAFIYETVRPLPKHQRGSMEFARLDRRVVSQHAVRRRDYLWKTYSAGSHRDAALVERLELEQRIGDLRPEFPRSQYGYQRGSKPASAALRQVRTLARFEPWGPLRDEWFEPTPETAIFEPAPELYDGVRLLVRRRASAGFGPFARLETGPLAFRHTTYAIPLSNRRKWEAQVALGTLLSSLGRYWLYMVSQSWGTWHDEVYAERLLDVPVRLTAASDPNVKRVLAAIRQLPEASNPTTTMRKLWDEPDTDDDVRPILRALDEAIFDLFGLSSAERDLVEDFWLTQRPAATRPPVLPSVEHGRLAQLSQETSDLGRYLQAFLEAWNPRLGDEGEFSWRVWRDPVQRTVLILFETCEANSSATALSFDDPGEEWNDALRRVGATLTRQQTRTLVTNSVLRLVTDTAIAVAKRDERRLWTPSAAREDAEATILQAMALQSK